MADESFGQEAGTKGADRSAAHEGNHDRTKYEGAALLHASTHAGTAITARALATFEVCRAGLTFLRYSRSHGQAAQELLPLSMGVRMTAS